MTRRHVGTLFGAFRHDESGAIVIIVAVAMVFLLGLAAIVIDLGSLYDHDRRLQTVVDAAVLAGAQELIYTGRRDEAENETRQYALDNMADSTVDATEVVWEELTITDTYVYARLRERNVPYTFARALPLGKTSGSVWAEAKAEVKYITGIQEAFPLALNHMTPDEFRLSYLDPTITVSNNTNINDLLSDSNNVRTSYTIAGDNDDVFEGTPGSYLPTQPGLYPIILEALADGQRQGDPLYVGAWRVAPSDAAIRRVGLSGMSIQVEVDPTKIAEAPTATLDGVTITLSGGPEVYLGTFLSAPESSTKQGLELFDITLDYGNGGSAVSEVVMKYVDFDEDAPILSFMLQPSFYDGYSFLLDGGGPATLGARITTRKLVFGQEYVLKLGKEDDFFAGNWRLLDLYSNKSLSEELAEVYDSTWTLWPDHNPLVIGGQVNGQTGQHHDIKNWLEDRFEGWDPAFTLETLPTTPEEVIEGVPPGDPHLVTIAMVDWASIHGSDHYRIQAFARFYITSWDRTTSEIRGAFIEMSTASSTWQDKPPGPVYLKTAVLTY